MKVRTLIAQLEALALPDAEVVLDVRPEYGPVQDVHAASVGIGDLVTITGQELAD